MRCRGQSLLELAVSLPVVLALALGSAAMVRLADARAGLDGATAAAVADAARQASAPAAAACAQQRFDEVVAGYGLTSPHLVLSGFFARGSMYHATATADLALDFVPLWFVPRTVRLTAHAESWVEPWRSRAGQPCPGASSLLGP